MKKLLIIATLALCYPLASHLWAKYFLSAPQIQLSSSSVLVGDAQHDHALFKLQPLCVIKATNIDYQFNSFGTGGAFLSKIGGRAILTSMQTPTYNHMLDDQKASGNCMASYLNRSEQDGLMSHLLLIPTSPEVLDQMRTTTLAEGAHFYLHGRPLTLEEAKIDNHPLNQIHGISYFLVDSFSSEK